jgi:menaquinone-specific isochorismate synthase
MSPSPGGRRLATITIPAPGLHPDPFLRHADGEPRGFWARGSRWVAHRGVVAEIRCEGLPGTDRFEDVREQALALARAPLVDADTTRAPQLRLYGGFAFRSDHRADGAWRAFPAALFHVPRFELEGRASGDAWLRARALVGPEDTEGALVRLRRDAEALRAELVTADGSSRRQPAPISGRSTATARVPWEDAVGAALAAIRGGRVSKVVLARTLDVELETELNPASVLARLWEANEGSHVFLFEPEPGRALLGAAPETVATLREGVFHATAVAGSVRRGETPEEQAALAAHLLASAKDRAEQRIALDDMVTRLGTVAHQIHADLEPHVLTLPGIQHLETQIRASVPGGTGVLDLLRLLHPTPAVCGLPRDEALAFLAEEEPFQRGWYAGPVGWFDADGNGVFAPALRTAVGEGSSWRLFAGAGIVEGSVPALEWEETAIKFDPVLRALGGAGADLGGEDLRTATSGPPPAEARAAPGAGGRPHRDRA